MCNEIIYGRNRDSIFVREAVMVSAANEMEPYSAKKTYFFFTVSSDHFIILGLDTITCAVRIMKYHSATLLKEHIIRQFI